MSRGLRLIAQGRILGFRVSTAVCRATRRFPQNPPYYDLMMPLRWVRSSPTSVQVSATFHAPASGITQHLDLGQATIWRVPDFTSLPGPGVLLVAPRGVCGRVAVHVCVTVFFP